jgi:N-sulfoglucosamine sulfohydrolase
MKKIILLFTVMTAVISLSFIILNKNSKYKSNNKKPNILFIIADDAGTDFSAYGSSFVKTPAFDRIAQEGVLFNKAYTPNAKCAPSRSCILTGRNSWQLDAGMNHMIYFPSYFKTFPEALSQNGYAVGYTGKAYAPGKSLDHEGKPRDLVVKNYGERLLPSSPTKGIGQIDYQANLKDFLNQKGDKPWLFWVGIYEPHRIFEYGTGTKLGGKKTTDIKKVPKYLPDSDSIRNDLLDYAFEIEHMDKQVGDILKMLEDMGELDNTLIVYTSDHGMPFPRTKGNQYEYSNHIPLAMMWKNGIKTTNRKIEDYINFTDLAPTFLQLAGVSNKASGMYPITGKSLLPIFNSQKSGQIEPNRNYVLVGQERHDYGRPNDVGYPMRGMHKNGMLYLRNYEPDRWPVCNPETGYLNCDGGASKSFILNQRRSGVEKKYWKLCFGHRPAEELYDVKNDPDCVNNQVNTPKYKAIAAQMKAEMEKKLRAEGDLRMLGYGHIYEQYPGADINGFYERYMKGERFKTGWVEPTDYEAGIIEDY